MIDVVAALIQEKNKILLAKRSRGKLHGKWEFPGGKIEEGETFESAIIREINEELNINIIPQEIIRTFTHTYSFAEIRLTFIKCKIIDNEIITSDGSHSEIKWFNLYDVNIELAPLDLKILKYLKKSQDT